MSPHNEGYPDPISDDNDSKETSMTLEDILELLNTEVFSDKEWNENNFYKIPEVTYSYKNVSENPEEKEKGPFLNLTLFRDLGGIDEEEFLRGDLSTRQNSVNAAGLAVSVKIGTKIAEIERYVQLIDEIGGSEDIVLKNRAKIIKGGLHSIVDTLRMALVALPLEKEKALIGHYFNADNPVVSDTKRAEILAEVESYNTQLFGPKLSTNDVYVKGTMDYYKTEFLKYDKKIEEGGISADRILSPVERERFEGYIARLGTVAPGYIPKENQYAEKVVESDFAQIHLNYDTTKNIFNENFEAIRRVSGNMPHVAKIDEDISNFTDTPEGVSLPSQDRASKPMNLSRMFELLAHEIEQHCVTIVQHAELVGNVRGDKNLELAEGAAMLNEALFKYGANLLKDSSDVNGKHVKVIDIDKLEYESNFPGTVMMEILSDEEFLDFCQLSHKIVPNKNSPLSRYLRLKRNGSQMKDTAYNIGREKAIRYYNEIIRGERDGDFSDLFLGKVGFHQIGELKEIKTEILARNNSLPENQKVRLPETIMFHELLYYTLNLKLNGGGIDGSLGEGYYLYLQEKYPFMDFSIEKIDAILLGFNEQILQAISITEPVVREYRERVDVILLGEE